MTAITIQALAKVNLDLRVLGTRPDGHHELRTVFQSIALHDTLTFAAKRGPFALRCRQPGVPTDATNLVWQAAALLWRAMRREGDPRDVVVTLEKQIPPQSGLGGGSADAAATLVALSRLWGYAFAPAQLRDLGAHLGADVPFSLWGGTALGLGRGDEIYTLVDLPQYWVVIVLPSFGVSTRDAYAWYDEEIRSGYRTDHEAQWLPWPWPSRAVQMVNHLEGPMARRLPEIGLMRAELRDRGAVAAAMTGSGSAVFGLFRRVGAARAASLVLRRAGWRVFLTRTVGRDEYVRRARPRVVKRIDRRS